ncbi:sigma-70 family RNA polymerase sigma factor [Mucilaginibacter celer]|uniref:Sigma-70 family RNA polymerase sigma factor n=1 Tax=Mucilaginibacter celer TaxID=2305508 RepID=A0A494W5R0_9SPHI|nr:sigma-70 family RNA polymerase sigma factor [Mucilaginibacter celer]AYL98845.1 sigma-70 family RNA polymerase sigma factor [Mucilaginibacter celer]
MQSPENYNTATNSLTDPRKWVDLHSDYLYKYALTRINDTETARELVQDTLLAGLERLDKFEGKSTERTWLTAILKNKVVDVYRKRSSAFIKQPGLETAEHEMDDFFEPDACNWKPDHRPQEFGIEQPDCLERKEFKQILQKCMQKLPGLWLSVFTMKHMDEEATDTICADLNITPSNFWVIIHRAKLNLRECLQKHWI